MDISSTAGNKNVLISLFDRTTPVLSVFPGFYPILHSEHDALVLIDLIPCLDNMGDVSFSDLIHSLMNFCIGTTQAGDNKFVSLMLACARHMAKPSEAARNT